MHNDIITYLAHACRRESDILDFVHIVTRRSREANLTPSLYNEDFKISTSFSIVQWRSMSKYMDLITQQVRAEGSSCNYVESVSFASRAKAT